MKPPADMAREIRDVKTIWGPTGLRSIGPEETFRNLGAILSRINIHTIEEIPAAETYGISVFKVMREKPEELIDKLERANIFRHRAFGKGLDAGQARVSGIMELVERFTANENGALDLVHAPYGKVKQQAVDIIGLLSRLDHQSQLSKHLISDTIITWCWGYSLVKEKPQLVPAFATFFPYFEKPLQVRSRINGLASGSTIEEAILHGLCELIERDAFQKSIIAPGSLDLSGIDLVRIDDFVRENMPERFNNGLRDSLFTFSIKNRAFDLDIYAFCSAVIRMDYYNRHSTLQMAIEKGKDVLLIAGRGASLDPEIALIRSFAELAELIYRHPPRERTPFLKRDEHYFNVKEFCEIENRSTGTLRGDIQKCIASFRARDMDIIIVDLTRKELGIPVVRVIAPELEHQLSFDLKRLRLMPKDGK